MAYHVSNYGSFAGDLRRFADLDGYVPEPGDSHDDLDWDSATEWTDDAWREHVAGAETARKAAAAELAAWRDGGR